MVDAAEKGDLPDWADLLFFLFILPVPAIFTGLPGGASGFLFDRNLCQELVEDLSFGPWG